MKRDSLNTEHVTEINRAKPGCLEIRMQTIRGEIERYFDGDYEALSQLYWQAASSPYVVRHTFI